MEINTEYVRNLMDNKDCLVCRRCSLSIGSDTCTKCLHSGSKCEFDLSRACLTCKHSQKKFSEEPCMGCDIQNGNSKWEELEREY